MIIFPIAREGSITGSLLCGRVGHCGQAIELSFQTIVYGGLGTDTLTFTTNMWPLSHKGFDKLFYYFCWSAAIETRERHLGLS